MCGQRRPTPSLGVGCGVLPSPRLHCIGRSLTATTHTGSPFGGLSLSASPILPSQENSQLGQKRSMSERPRAARCYSGHNPEKGETVAGLREVQAQGPGGFVGPARHLTCPAESVARAATSFPSSFGGWGGKEGEGQYFKQFPSSLLPFLAACQRLSYGKQNKGSDFTRAWTRISNPRLKTIIKIMAIICLCRSQAGCKLEMGLAMLLGAGVGFGQRGMAIRNHNEEGPPKRSK